MNLRTAVAVAAFAALGLAPAARAEETPAEISRKSRERGALNLLGLSAELKLTTVSKGGTPKEQVLVSSGRKVEGKNHSIARFSAPPAVAGVAVLTVEGLAGEPSDISLYLPKLKRVRKVAKQQRGQSFMDTDFNYADLGGTGENDEAQHRGPDQKAEGRDCYVLSGAAGADSPYSKVTVYVDQQTYVPMKAEYLDREGKPVKLYRALKLKKFKDRVIASESVMENLQTGSKTTLEVLKVEESKLGDEAFSERALERG